MKKVMSLLLIFLLCFALCSCGDKVSTSVESEADNTDKVTAEEATEKTVEVAKAVEVGFNEKIALDFVEITFKESYIKEDIRQTIEDNSSGFSISRTFGPSPVDGQQFICLKGKIKNIAKEDLPVFDFFLGEFDIDGYKYESTANECDVYTSNGETKTSVPPLSEYDFVMYAEIPDEVANSGTSIDFRFGFYDMFDNQELSRNRAFEDDAISMCPYQYSITIK